MRSAIWSRWSEWELQSRSSDDLLYGDVLGAFAVLPLLVPGHGVAAPKPAVESGHHLVPALVEDEEGVPVGRHHVLAEGLGWQRRWSLASYGEPILVELRPETSMLQPVTSRTFPLSMSRS